MNEERPVIECRNVTHYYGKKLVYENLNIVVPEGHIMGLLGKNGAGKSTTINILNGFLEPRSGQCLIYGEDTQNLSPETKKRIGYLIEGHIQYSFMNVHQIEKFYSGFYENWKSDAYWSLINRLKITPKQKISDSFWHKIPTCLSSMTSRWVSTPATAASSSTICGNTAKPNIKPCFSPHTSYRIWNDSSTTSSSWITTACWYKAQSRTSPTASKDSLSTSTAMTWFSGKTKPQM